jgi:hypothetical protein
MDGFCFRRDDAHDRDSAESYGGAYDRQMAATLGCREHFHRRCEPQEAGREALGFSEEMTCREFRLVGGFP